ncbi:hypothetical protein GCM10025864_24850 [Luteimicrobium album]|uniref:Uncharacterized protein n=1 Tax=Luteimicrobium album TaxID=1054550 RepID=A0ABQ6I215_9MICO|nr:hypothetical protein GCM10025864_24850 [Luteimicrobium album]
MDGELERPAHGVGAAPVAEGVAHAADEHPVEAVEQPERLAGAPEAGEPLERGERDDHLGLVLVVAERALGRAEGHAGSVLPVVPGAGEVGPRVDLQGQRTLGGEHLEEVRQPGPVRVLDAAPEGRDGVVAHEVDEAGRGAVVQGARRGHGVRPQPELGGGRAVDVQAEELLDDVRRAPVVRLDGVLEGVEAVHRRARLRRSAAPGSGRARSTRRTRRPRST